MWAPEAGAELPWGMRAGASKIWLSLAKGYLGMIQLLTLRRLWPHDQGHPALWARPCGSRSVCPCTRVFSTTARNGPLRATVPA